MSGQYICILYIIYIQRKYSFFSNKISGFRIRFFSGNLFVKTVFNLFNQRWTRSILPHHMFLPIYKPCRGLYPCRAHLFPYLTYPNHIYLESKDNQLLWMYGLAANITEYHIISKLILQQIIITNFCVPVRF